MTLSAVVPYVRLEPTGAFVEGHAAVLRLGAGAAATRAGRAGRRHRSRKRANASVFVRVLDRTLFVRVRVHVVFVTLRVSLGGCVGRSDVVVSPASSPFVGVVASSFAFFHAGGGKTEGRISLARARDARGGAFAEREPSAGKRRRRSARGGFGGTRDEDVSAGLELAGGEGAPWDVRRVFRLGGLGVARARRLDAAAAKEEHEFRAAVQVFVLLGGVRGRVARDRPAARRGLARGPASYRSRQSGAHGSPEGGW